MADLATDPMLTTRERLRLSMRETPMPVLNANVMWWLGAYQLSESKQVNLTDLSVLIAEHPCFCVLKLGTVLCAPCEAKNYLNENQT